MALGTAAFTWQVSSRGKGGSAFRTAAICETFWRPPKSGGLTRFWNWHGNPRASLRSALGYFLTARPRAAGSTDRCDGGLRVVDMGGGHCLSQLASAGHCLSPLDIASHSGWIFLSHPPLEDGCGTLALTASTRRRRSQLRQDEVCNCLCSRGVQIVRIPAARRFSWIIHEFC